MGVTRAVLLLCDYAHVAEGKLYISGGGWSVTGPGPSRLGLAVKVDLSPDQQDSTHELRLSLHDDSGEPVLVDTADGEPAPLEIVGEFKVGPAREDAVPKATLDIPFAVNLMQPDLAGGRIYEWQLRIDGETRPEWRAPFTARLRRDPSRLGA